MDELVSIIMPAYNAEIYIAAAIESVISQTYKVWELLIINDGSTDATASIAQRYANEDSRICVISQTNQRLGAARNTGLKQANGTWIAFLDSDDLWEPIKLEKQLQLSEKLPHVDMIFTSGWTFNYDNRADLFHYQTITGEYGPDEMYQKEFEVNHILVMSVIVKKTMTEAVGLQEVRPEFYGCEDWDYWLRMALNGAIFYGMADQLVYYRQHGSNMSSNFIKMRLAEANVYAKNYRPGMVSATKKNAAILPLVNTLIIALIKAGNKAEAHAMLSDMQSLIPRYVKYYRQLLNIANKNTIKYFAVLNRLYVKVKRRVAIN
ncbi:glycosyltransferase family 2 protein [Mucilaginibacter sp. HD30]